MKNLLSTAISIMFVIGISSCEQIGLGKDKPNTLSGDTDVAINTIGNTFSNTVSIGDQYIETEGKATLLSNDDGVLTIKGSAIIPTTNPLYQYLPDSIKKGGGKIEGTFKIKSTSEGILDYFNKDQKPFTLVKYDAKVGDTYQVTKDDGNTITRKVTARSTDDDYDYGFLLIKVIEVEQDSRIPGVEKIVYYANHKFGLVGVKLVMEDGTSSKMTLWSKYPAK